MPTLNVSRFRDLAADLLRAAGAPVADIPHVVESVTWASLRGVDTHGAGHLPIYARMYMGENGIYPINVAAEMRVVRERAAVVVIDADGGAGQRAMSWATETAVQKARNAGVAATAVQRCTHQGALGCYAEMIAERDCVGLIFACSGAASPPTGGADRQLGTNPLAVAIPSSDTHPILIDMATSASTWLGLVELFDTGGDVPEGLLLDDAGNPTSDRSDFAFGTRRGEEGPLGSLANMGSGPKGYSLQLAVEMLGGILPALASGIDATRNSQIPALVIAFDVGAFQDLGVFKTRVASRVAELKASRRKDGVSEIFLPGERGYRIRDQRLVDGIPVDAQHWKRFGRVAADLGLDLAEYVDDQMPSAV